jgi:hypothetical protein
MCSIEIQIVYMCTFDSKGPEVDISSTRVLLTGSISGKIADLCGGFQG